MPVWTTGEIPTAAKMNQYAGGSGAELAYAEITAAVNLTATTEATANTIITAPAVTVDGSTAILIMFYSQYVYPGTGATSLWLFQDGVSVGRISYSPGTVGIPQQLARR